MVKSLKENFADWEGNTFGFGYGTGEEPVLRALKGFFDLIGEDPALPRSYNYQRLDEELGPQVTWLLINALCRYGVDIIDYGSSPRYGWLTEEGEALKLFVDRHTIQELVDICCRRAEGSIVCDPDACNCGSHGYQEGAKCFNPFWAGHH